MIDELNIINKDNGIEQRIRSYFKKMPMISEKQIEERTDFAKKMFDLMMLFFAMVGTTSAIGGIQDIDYYLMMLIRRYEDNVEESFDDDLMMASYIAQFSQQMVNNTISKIEEPYTLSEDRAFDISVNESNTTLGQYEYQQAIRSGKTMKQWMSEHDMRVRNSHMIVDGTEIPIKQYFHVGSSLMLYPHDAVNGDAREVVNCRCHVRYFISKRLSDDTNNDKIQGLRGLNAAGDKYPIHERIPNDMVVNPNNNHKDEQWYNNCQSSVVAMEMKFRGEKSATALPYIDERYIGNMDDYATLWRGAKVSKLDLKDIDKMPIGRYAVSIDEKDDGHLVMINSTKDGIQLFDCSENIMYNNVVDALKYMTKDGTYNSFKYFRIDDKKLTNRGKSFYGKG